MPTDLAESAVLPAPIDRVWAITAATDRYAEWVDACVAVTEHHGAATVGQTYAERNTLLGPLKTRSHWTVAEADAPRYRRDTGTGFPLVRDLESIFELEAVDEQHTRITYRVRYVMGAGPLGRVIDKVQQGGMRKGMQRSLAALETLV